MVKSRRTSVGLVPREKGCVQALSSLLAFAGDKQLCGPRIAGLMMGISKGLCAFRALCKHQPVCLLPCKCCLLGRRNPALPSECSSPTAFQFASETEKTAALMCRECGLRTDAAQQAWKHGGAGLTSPGSSPEFRAGRDQHVPGGRRAFWAVERSKAKPRDWSCHHRLRCPVWREICYVICCLCLGREGLQTSTEGAVFC